MSALLLLLALAAQGAPALDVQLLPVRADRALDAWQRVPARFEPHFAPVTRACPGEELLLLVPLRGLATDAQGRARATLDLEQREADGSPGPAQRGVVAWDGPLPGPGAAVLPRLPLGIAFPQDAAPGTLALTVRVTDEVAGLVLERSATVELRAWEYGDVPADAQAYGPWRNRYHRLPAPQQAVRAFLEFAALEDPATASFDFEETGFFVEVFRGRPWLLGHLVDTARAAGGERAQRAAILLQLCGESARIPELYPDDPSRGEQARATLEILRFPDPYGPLEHAAQVDLLWGEFFASARWRPLRQVVEVLRHLPEGDPQAAFAASPQGATERAALARAQAARHAAASLAQAITWHPLVAQYVTGMLEDPAELAPDTHALLTEILRLAVERRRAEAADAPAGDTPR